MPRPRKYESNADRQAAYRHRINPLSAKEKAEIPLKELADLRVLTGQLHTCINLGASQDLRFFDQFLADSPKETLIRVTEYFRNLAD